MLSAEYRNTFTDVNKKLQDAAIEDDSVPFWGGNL
jgi:hypothetical protein